VATRISRTDGQPMGIAGLWTGWKGPDGEVVRSMTMLTVNEAVKKTVFRARHLGFARFADRRSEI
jgi:putative SOS response-associated peptidase YedK